MNRWEHPVALIFVQFSGKISQLIINRLSSSFGCCTLAPAYIIESKYNWMEIKSGTNYCYNRHPPQDQVPPPDQAPPKTMAPPPPSTSGQYASYWNAILYFPNLALADLRGSGQRVSCSFGENLAKPYVGTPPFGELAPPPMGNPGSATVLCEKVECDHPPLNEGSVFPRREGEGVLKYYFMTRMHSSRMRTARSLTVSHSICHACPPAMHVPQPCMPPSHTCPLSHACSLPCMPPATHAPHHACPPAMHTPLPQMPPRFTWPPASHTPSGHACPLPCTPPRPWHGPLPRTPPPPHLWTEFLTHASENITLPQLRSGR